MTASQIAQVIEPGEAAETTDSASWLHTRVAFADVGGPTAGLARHAAERLADLTGGKPIAIGVDREPAARARLARLSAWLPADVRTADSGSPQGAKQSAADTPVVKPYRAVADALQAGDNDIIVMPARDGSDAEGDSIGTLLSRVLRYVHRDVLIVRDPEGGLFTGDGPILVCIDGSKQSYAGLLSALALAAKLGRKVEAVGVYDPYLHYTLFNGIVNVLSDKAKKVFKFEDQEKLHEEIIDTGLARIYQAHLEVAEEVARDHGVALTVTLLDGKAFSRIIRHVQRSRPSLLVLGRIGVHSEQTQSMDIGGTAENLVRATNCDLLVSSRTFVPPIDVKARASIEWTPEARAKMTRVPDFVRGVATTAVLRWAQERGHSIVSTSVINSAMGDLLPRQAAQAMGYVAEELAKAHDELDEYAGKTYICRNCGHAVRDLLPVSCKVCNAESHTFDAIDREAVQRLGKLEKGALITEATFDGKKLRWAPKAMDVLRRVPTGFERRTARARIEKNARVRGFDIITEDFALDMVEQDLANSSYLSDKGERLQVDLSGIGEALKPDDDTPREREGSELPWTDAAWKRVGRVPIGFMRDMTLRRVEQFANDRQATEIRLPLCEEGIAWGREQMAAMLGNYGKDKDEIRKQAKGAKTPDKTAGNEKTAENEKPVEKTAEWTDEAVQAKDAKVEKSVEAGKFDADRADELARNVAEEKAREKRLTEIGESFMQRLGVQLGYGHPLSEKTSQHKFTWTAEAEKQLEDVPAFCREMTRWRVEWTAVKKDLGRTITPELMAVKYELWGEISDKIKAEGTVGKIEWEPGTAARVERIPDFVKGQVMQSVEGNALAWGFDKVNDTVLDRVIQKWIDTGDFHEQKYGYK